MKLFTVLVFLAVLSLSVAFLSDLLRLKAVSAIIGGNKGGASANSGGHSFTKLLWCRKTPSEFRWLCANSNHCKSLVQLQCVSGRCCAMDYGTLMLIGDIFHKEASQEERDEDNLTSRSTIWTISLKGIILSCVTMLIAESY